MAGKDMELSISIGGYLSSTLTQALGNAKNAFKSLGNSGKEAAKKLEAINRIASNQQKLEKQTMRLHEAQEKLSKATQAYITYTGSNADKQARLLRKQEEARAKVAQLSQKTDELAKKNRVYQASVEKLHGPLSKLIKEQKELEQVENRRKKLKDLEEKANKHAELAADRIIKANQHVMAIQNMINIARPWVNSAMQAQNISFELGTVINASDKKAAIAQAEKSAQDLAKAGYTSYEDAMTVQYSLNSAGLTADLASVAVKTVASVAKVTKGELGQVGEVIATMNNNLGGKMAGTAAERFAAMGNILTKVQFKYQIRDFAQLGESMKYAATGINQYNVDLKQSAAAIGMLNSAGLQGSMAGTSFNAMMKGLYKTAAEIPGILVKNKDGTVDLAGSLANLQKGLSKMDDITRASFLNKNFGAEGAKGIVPLVAKVNELADGAREIGDAVSGNLVDAEMTKYLELTSTKMQAARQQAELLGVKLGNILLPSLTKILEYAVKLADAIGDFADKHPQLTQIIVAVGALNLAFNGVAAAVNYGIASYQTMLSLMNVGKLIAYKGAIIATNIATKAWAAIQWALNAAMTANPIWLVVVAIGALVAVIAVLYKKFEKVRNIVNATWSTLKKAGGVIGKFFKGAGEKVTAPTTEVPAYASGGYVNSPTLGLVGEAGPEMIVPLSNRAQGLQRLRQASAVLGASGAVSINYAPNITITGNADRQQIAMLLREHKSELKAMLEEIARDNRRVAFA